MSNYRVCWVSCGNTDVSCRAAFDRLADPEAGYDRLLAAVFAYDILFSDAFCRAMEALGNECVPLLPGIARLQAAWARENGLPTDGPGWQERILAAQIAAARPDVLYVQGLGSNAQRLLGTGLKERYPFLRQVAGYSGFGFDMARDMDILFVAWPGMQRRLAAVGVPSTVVYHGFVDSVTARLPHRAGLPPIPCSFVGASGYPTAMTRHHTIRFRRLLHLLATTDLEVWAPDHSGSNFRLENAQKNAIERMVERVRKIPDPDRRLNALLAALDGAVGGGSAKLPLGFLFPDRVHPPVFGLDMYETLRRSQVSVNIHVDFVPPEVANMRMFETTGVGTCMLVEDGRNIRDLFVPGEEVVTYSGDADCARKLRELRDHPGECVRIGRAGQRRTLREHTVAHRVARIDERLQEALAAAR